MPIVRNIPIVVARMDWPSKHARQIAAVCLVVMLFAFCVSPAKRATASDQTDVDDPTAAATNPDTEPNATRQRFPNAQEIYHCTFDGVGQIDVDGWPNGWTRQQDINHPRYVEIRVDSASPTSGDHSLGIMLDGGAAAVYSPPLSISSLFNYLFECQVQTDGLTYDQAYLSVTFYDAQNNLLERQVSSPVGKTTAWTKLRIGPVASTSNQAQHAVIGLHLEPGERADLRGKVWFADVWAGRFPKLLLQAGGCRHLYAIPESPEVICTASGFSNQNAGIEIQLLDVEGQEIQRARVALETHSMNDADKTQQLLAGSNSGVLGQKSAVFIGSAAWKPALPDVGFYHVRAHLDGCSYSPSPCETTIALIRKEEILPQGEFGWTLPQGERPLTFDELTFLAEHSGIHWLKFPVWNAAADQARGDQLASFAQRLQNNHTQLVGLLADPPMEVRKRLSEATHVDEHDQPLAAQIFSAKSEVWYPSLEPILTRLQLLVHTWQLGSDDDLSFVKFPQLGDALLQVHKQLGRFGQVARLAIPWTWHEELPKEMAAGDFVSFWVDPPASSSAQRSVLDRTQEGTIQRWVAIQTLPASKNNLKNRVGDLVQQMLAAKLHGAQRIFLPELCNSEYGLLQDDGTVGELLLPWRTVAQVLSGTDDMGNLQLPHGSSNQLFVRDRQLVMLLWNDHPSEEQISLGENVQQQNIWGQVTQPELDGKRQCCIQVDRLPVFLTNLNLPLVQWQITTKLSHNRWPNELGIPLENAIKLSNPFSQTVTGAVQLDMPNRWRVVPRSIPFKLAAGQTVQLPFEATLPFDLVSGPQEVHFDFDIVADRHYQFSVYRTIDVGDDSVTVNVATHLNEQGELVVEQKLLNQTDQPVSFQCSLYIPDRRRMTTNILDQGKGSDTQIYRLPNGQALLGKTLWLKAEETIGQRILNSKFVAQP